MEINKIGSSFAGIKIGKIPAYARIHIPSFDEMLNFTKSADIFINACEKEFPYNGNNISKMLIPALKISARPINLSFWEKLFNKRMVTDYFPFGNMRASIVYDKNKKVIDVISELVSKVK